MMNLGRNDHEEYQKKGNESRGMERMTHMSQIWRIACCHFII